MPCMLCCACRRHLRCAYALLATCREHAAAALLPRLGLSQLNMLQAEHAEWLRAV
jgi:hypothetical protein